MARFITKLNENMDIISIAHAKGRTTETYYGKIAVAGLKKPIHFTYDRIGKNLIIHQGYRLTNE